jgi:hypothetical protein
MRLTVVLLILALVLRSGISRAQQSIWEGGKEKMLSTKEKGQKKISQVQQWKNHIQQWGLDSNYNHALSLSARLNTNGWSGGIYYLKQLSAGKKAVWQLHFSELKHEKEVKQQRSDNRYSHLGKNTAYILGKMNNAYTLQLGYGREQMLFPALIDGNLSVSLRYVAGASLAVLKPYYLNLIYVEYTPEEKSYSRSEKYTPANADHSLRSAYILGSDKWSKGLGEMKYIPGVFAELAFAIEPEKPKSFVKTITIGGNAAFYASKIEIMAERKAYPYQASFFVGLALGKRWR